MTRHEKDVLQTVGLGKLEGKCGTAVGEENKILSLKIQRGRKLYGLARASMRVLARIGALIMMGLFLWAALQPARATPCGPALVMPPPPCWEQLSVKVLR